MKINMLSHIKKIMDDEHELIITADARGTGKTVGHTQIMLIHNLTGSNCLIARQYQTTVENNFNEMIQLLTKTELINKFKINKKDKSLINLINNKEIRFLGMDKPENLMSLKPKISGEFSKIWIEEAYQIKNKDAFDKLYSSVARSKHENDIKFKCYLSLNPWNSNHWIKKDLIDKKEIKNFNFYTHSYKVNERNLNKSYLEQLENLKIKNYERYKVEALGIWGNPQGQIFKDYKVIDFNLDLLEENFNYSLFIGMDFGFKPDPTALILGLYCEENKSIYIIDEFYLYEAGVQQLAEKLVYFDNYELGNKKFKTFITADNSNLQMIESLKAYGYQIIPAKKGPNSIEYGIEFIKEHNLFISGKCENFIKEIDNYTYSEKIGSKQNIPKDKDNHLIDSLRYGLERFYPRIQKTTKVVTI